MKMFITLCALLIGCAAVQKTQTVVPRKPDIYLIIKAPKSIFGNLDPKNHTFSIYAKNWADGAYSEHTRAYCTFVDDYLLCMVTVHESHAKFELFTEYLDPGFGTAERAEIARRLDSDEAFRREFSEKVMHPDPFCGKVRVGITVDRSGFSGGRPTAAYWFDLDSQREGWCQYEIPAGAFTAAREAIKKSFAGNDILTD